MRAHPTGRSPAARGACPVARGGPYPPPMTDPADGGRAPARRARGRLPQLARHPQPRGWRRRARPRGGGRGAGRARRPGDGLQRRARRRAAGGRDPRRPLRAPRLEAQRLRPRHAGPAPRRPRAPRPGGRRPERAAVLHPAGDPHARSIVLVHHVHREQWPVVYPGTMGKVGWWIESRLRAAALPPVPVRHRLAGHPRRAGAAGRGPPTGSPSCTTAPTGSVRSRSARPTHPSICVVGRLVPHKQVEHALDAVAELRDELPGPHRDRGRQRLVGARPARVRREARARRLGAVPGSGRRGDQGAGLRGVVGARPPLAEGGLGPGRRRGRRSPAPRPWPTPAPAAPASRSWTASPACWSTTRPGFVDALRRLLRRRRAAHAAGRGRAHARRPVHVGADPGPASRTWCEQALAGRRVSTD